MFYYKKGASMVYIKMESYDHEKLPFHMLSENCSYNDCTGIQYYLK